MKKTHIRITGSLSCLVILAIAAIPFAIAWLVILTATILCQQ